MDFTEGSDKIRLLELVTLLFNCIKIRRYSSSVGPPDECPSSDPANPSVTIQSSPFASSLLPYHCMFDRMSSLCVHTAGQSLPSLFIITLLCTLKTVFDDF